MTLLAESPPLLSRRMLPVERRILLALARGRTRAQIEAHECLSRTVLSARITDLHRLFGVSSSAHMVARAHAAGLLERDRVLRPALRDVDLRRLRLIADGAPDREIGPRSTSRVASSDLYRRLGAKNRPNAVHLAFCAGLLGGAS
jgi:DNA-binding CsgD family transcriptional regulator